MGSRERAANVFRRITIVAGVAVVLLTCRGIGVPYCISDPAHRSSLLAGQPLSYAVKSLWSLQIPRTNEQPTQNQSPRQLKITAPKAPINYAQSAKLLIDKKKQIWPGSNPGHIPL